MPVLCQRRLCGCNGDGNNNQLKAEVVIASAMATATAGGSSNDNDGTMPDAKGVGAEVIGMGGDNKDCGADAGSLLTAVVRLQRWRKQQST
jgi:hypothetical protein